MIEEQQLARTFALKIKQEAPDFIKAVVHFGSTTGVKEQLTGSDIDVLLIVNDQLRILSNEFITGFRVIVERVASDISPRFHITTMKLTQFWEYVAKGDPIVINMLRSGTALLDDGFFATAKKLGDEKRLMPTQEVIFSYLSAAPKAMNNAKWHVTRATMSLFWSALNSAHAALLAHSILPHSPEVVGELIKQQFVDSHSVAEKHFETYRQLERIMADIGQHTHTVSAETYDHLKPRVYEFNKEMERVILLKDP